jgi:hypothetical protein
MGDKSRPHAKLEIYPRYCFDLAPTHNKWCFLRAADIKRLKQPKDYQGACARALKSQPGSMDLADRLVDRSGLLLL